MDDIFEKNKKLQTIGEPICEENYKKLLAAKVKIQKEVCVLVDISKSKTQNGQRNGSKIQLKTTFLKSSLLLLFSKTLE